MEASLQQTTSNRPLNLYTKEEREQMLTLYDHVLPDDAGSLGNDWKRLMVPYLKETVVSSINVKDYRELYGRPIRLLRTLTGMSEKDAAGFLKLKLTDYRQLEARGLNEVNIFEVSRAIVALAVGLGKVSDERYMQAAWYPALDPDNAGEPMAPDYVRRAVDRGIEEFVENFIDGPNDALRVIL